jgi:hypothetical protein
MSMKCSLCGGDLLRGRAAVRKSVAAKLNWPFPSDRLFFKLDGDNQKSETILKEGVSYESFKCEQCGGVVLTGKRWVAEPAISG